MKKRILIGLAVVLAVAAAASVVWASGPTPYIVFHDDFEGEDLSQWSNVDGFSEIVDDDGNKVLRHTGGEYVGAVTAVTGSDAWTDYVFEVDVKKISGTYFNLVFRYVDQSTYYMVEGGSSGQTAIALFKRVGSGFTQLDRVPQVTTNGTWYHYMIQAEGDSIKVWVDGALKFNVTDAAYPAGKIGVGGYSSQAHFDDVVVTALYGTQWLPPISLPDWTLNDRATLPIKFQLYDLDGNLVTCDLTPVLTVSKLGDSSADLPLTCMADDSDNPYHYHVNYKPGEVGDYTATVRVGAMTVGEIGFAVTEPPVANGRGKSH